VPRPTARAGTQKLKPAAGTDAGIVATRDSATARLSGMAPTRRTVPVTLAGDRAHLGQGGGHALGEGDLGLEARHHEVAARGRVGWRDRGPLPSRAERSASRPGPGQ